MAIYIGRRQLLAAAALQAAAWPLAARTQQTPVQMIGYLDQGPSEDAPELVVAFRERLRDRCRLGN
jgi:hypothetical protein